MLRSRRQAYGEGDEAYRAAFTAPKQGSEKRGDHWMQRRRELVRGG